VLPTEPSLALLLALPASSAPLPTSCKRRAPFAPSHETISFSIDNIVGYRHSHSIDVHEVVWGGWNEEWWMESKVDGWLIWCFALLYGVLSNSDDRSCEWTATTSFVIA
jgi:hypothetical protein